MSEATTLLGVSGSGAARAHASRRRWLVAAACATVIGIGLGAVALVASHTPLERHSGSDMLWPLPSSMPSSRPAGYVWWGRSAHTGQRARSRSSWWWATPARAVSLYQLDDKAPLPAKAANASTADASLPPVKASSCRSWVRRDAPDISAREAVSHNQARPYSCVADDELSSLKDIFYESSGKGDCTVLQSVWTCAEGQERVMLVGPFESVAMQWHFMHVGFPLLQEDDRIVRYAGDTLDATSGAPITYPPLHMHHIHIEREIPHFFETHGDYLLDGDSGYVTNLPAGTCVRHDGSDVTVLAHVNDVRFAHEVSTGHTAMAADGHTAMAADGHSHVKRLQDARAASKPYRWFLRVRMELATPDYASSCKPVDKVAFYYMYDKLTMTDVLGRYDAGNSTHIAFWPVQPQRAGRFIGESARIHAHRARYAGYLLVRGDHSLRSLTGLPDACTQPGAARPAACGSLAAARERVIEAAGERLLCQDDPKAASYTEMAADARGVGTGGPGVRYDRQGRIVCSDFPFESGETLTVFSFSTPVWAAELQTFPQHMILFGYAHPKPEGVNGVGMQKEALGPPAHYTVAQQWDGGGKYGKWDMLTGAYHSLNQKPFE